MEGMSVNPELIARISPEHRRRLAWFEEHQGEVSSIPGPLPDGQLLVSKPKGIYKPEDLPYALSIRINLDSPYADGVPVLTRGGGWLLSLPSGGRRPGCPRCDVHQPGPDAMQGRPGSRGRAPRAGADGPPQPVRGSWPGAAGAVV